MILVGNRHTSAIGVEASPGAGARTDASLASMPTRHQGRPVGSLALVGTGRADRRIWRAKILRRRPQRLPHMPMSERVLVEISVPPNQFPPARTAQRWSLGETARPVLRAALRYDPPAYRRADPASALSAWSRTWSGPR